MQRFFEKKQQRSFMFLVVNNVNSYLNKDGQSTTVYDRSKTGRPP